MNHFSQYQEKKIELFCFSKYFQRHNKLKCLKVAKLKEVDGVRDGVKVGGEDDDVDCGIDGG